MIGVTGTIYNCHVFYRIYKSKPFQWHVTIPFLNESAVKIQMVNFCGLKLKFISIGLTSGLRKQNSVHCVQKETGTTSLYVLCPLNTLQAHFARQDISMLNHKPVALCTNLLLFMYWVAFDEQSKFQTK